MENRYKLPLAVQKSYLLNVEKASGLKGEELARVVGVVGRSYRDWKRGKFPISQSAVDIIERLYSIKLPYSKEKALLEWKNAKIAASRNGGIATLKKYGGPGTYEGRVKGGKKAMAILRARGIVGIPKPFFGPKERTSELSELVGILLGDGHIGKEQWSITLNSVADREYLNYVKSLVERLFGFTPSIYYKKDCNAVCVMGSGIRSIEYFVSLGLKVGNKVKQQVGVPDWILGEADFAISCLRGLMDTDGGVFLHKFTVNKKKYCYKKLSFANRSVPLLNFVYETLSKLGFTPKTVMKVENKRVWLYNQREVDEYLNLVKTHNPRLLKYSGGLPEWFKGTVC